MVTSWPSMNSLSLQRRPPVTADNRDSEIVIIIIITGEIVHKKN